MKNRFLFLWMLLHVLSVSAQNNIPMGTWRSHFNYQETFLIERTPTKVIATTNQGLSVYDQEDNSLIKLSKIDGLSDVGISAIAFDSQKDLLFLGYKSGNIDVISSDRIINNTVLLKNKTIENRTVNHISYSSDHYHVSTDFGVLIISSDSHKVDEAYQNLGKDGSVLVVNESVTQGTKMYLATEEGVLMGDQENGSNLQDFNNWNRFENSPLYEMDIISLAANENGLYAVSVDSLFVLRNNLWEFVSISLSSNESIQKIKPLENGVLLVTNKAAYSYEAGALLKIPAPITAQINDIAAEDSGTYWYADARYGLTRLINSNTENFVPNGPGNGSLSKLKEINLNIYAFSDLNINIDSDVSNNVGYSVFSEGIWSTVDSTELLGVTNISDIAWQGGAIMVSSFSKGIVNETDQRLYNDKNSPLEQYSTGTNNILVSGLATDKLENLWVTTFGNYSLLKKSMDDQWEQFEFGFSVATEPISLSINSNQQLWMTLGLNGESGLLGYDIEKDVSRYITTASASLPSNRINDIAFGREEEIWVATDKGVVYFPYSFGIIEDHSVDPIVPIFENSYLFEGKLVSALAVDGGNRIWMGTNDGVWLFEENISEVVRHFTTENSPLPSNIILDLAIQSKSGEVFISTKDGLVSYRGDATIGEVYHQSVKIFPNPVAPMFQGLVGISGLANDAIIKITSLSGRLVREIKANGGGASWDVADYNGKRVKTGVYMVFSSSEDGSETFVGKIAVIE